MNCGETQACAPEAETRCTHAGFEEDFCKSFATLVASVHSGDADAVAAEQFCKQHASVSPATATPVPAVPAALAAAPAAPASTAAPVAASDAPDPEGSLTDCV